MNSPLSESFKSINQKAHALFHVSSEGELEQIRFVLQEMLLNQKKIEIIFTSESVEKKCVLLAEQYPRQIRILRLPLLSFFPWSFLYFQSIWSWATSSKIFFCRYDFFPELLALKLFNKKLILLSGATKKINWFKINCYLLFDYIVAANHFEKNNFNKLLKNKIQLMETDDFDFRIPRINERIKSCESTLLKYPNVVDLLTKLNQSNYKNKIILGSAWESDIEILNNFNLISSIKSGETFILIAPHKLNYEFIENLKNKVENILTGVICDVINNENMNINSSVAIITIPGILCELYSYFPLAYVGGGFEKSIHSVLEPFLSGSKVVCGPLIHRSTEFDFIANEIKNEIISIQTATEFYDIMKSMLETPPNKKLRLDLNLRLIENQKTIMNKIDSL